MSGDAAIGTVLYNLGEGDGAVAALSRAVELAPGSVRAHESLGTALWRLGRQPEGATHLQRGAALGSAPPGAADLTVPRAGAAGADGS